MSLVVHRCSWRVGVPVGVLRPTPRLASVVEARNHSEVIVSETATFFILILSRYQIPLACAAEILRHRLWDIDFIINCTLVYVSLSVVLAAVFAITEQLLQSLLVIIAGEGEQSRVVTYGSVVVIAVAFQPVRHRIEVVVNRLVQERSCGDGEVAS
jgi:hypothetical protein